VWGELEEGAGAGTQRADKAQAAMDEAIYKKEGEYLENTPHGNILTGFDNYIKGVTSSGAGGRRKQGVGEADRVFSRSSIRLAGGDVADSPGVLSAQTTPSGAPTPVAAGVVRERESGHATPTSATSKSGAGKKNKRGTVGGEEDSEMEEREGKKARGGARK